MKVVIDGSVMLAGLLPDERESYAVAVLEALERRTIQGIVPPLFDTEVSNGLLMAMRRQRIERGNFLRLLELLEVVPLHRVAAAITKTAVYAEKHGLTFYDATYLCLAVEQGAQLATLDSALLRAAQAEGVYFEGTK